MQFLPLILEKTANANIIFSINNFNRKEISAKKNIKISLKKLFKNGNIVTDGEKEVGIIHSPSNNYDLFIADIKKYFREDSTYKIDFYSNQKFEPEILFESSSEKITEAVKILKEKGYNCPKELEFFTRDRNVTLQRFMISFLISCDEECYLLSYIKMLIFLLK